MMRSTLLLLLLLPLEVMSASILIIESYHKEYEWDLAYNRGIYSILGDRHSYHHSYMDTKRIPPEQFQTRAQSAWEDYQRLKPDLVVLADDNAIRLLKTRLGKTETPVVFLGLNSNPREYGLQRLDNFTGVLERPIFKRSVLLANQVLPKKNSKQFLVISDSSDTSSTSLKQISPSLERLAIGKISVDFEQPALYETWKTHILDAKRAGYDAIFVGLYHNLLDESGQHIPEADVMSWIRLNSPVPHFGFWDFSIGARANVGGYVLDGYLHGRLAGELMQKILAGNKPRSLHYVYDRKGQYIFSQSGVKQWNLQIPNRMRALSKWTN